MRIASLKTLRIVNMSQRTEGENMRLIDADALLQEVDELKKSPWFNKNYDWARFVCNETMEIIESLCIDAAPAVDAEPTILSVGVVKEYDNGMVAMRKETYQEYHTIAVNEAVRRLFYQR